ncbi:phosphatidylinositol 4,5-bisphosphate 5-phosphatase A [Malaclemys terrapin pileata]|uniref:phosphatidylinositol 4,5-bisphosphate 5-phosphatase A n=1 Tax=Malaclemys terrapin pileata TaxID=2991368 RepID=UPI0023A8BE95|nr:phosphatidylinositol 4,5-bisphosphate 5-phosphatase A [Malaclemys terrapin pileata]
MEQSSRSSRRPGPGRRTAGPQAGAEPCGSHRKMEPAHRGNKDQGPASAMGAPSLSPRGSITATSPGPFAPLVAPFGAEGSVRFQPEGSSGPISAAYTGGNLPLGHRGSRPDTLFDPFHPVSPRSQPEGSQHVGPEERSPGRHSQPQVLESSRAQPDGSGGVQLFTLLSPVEFRPLSPGAGSPSSHPSQSPSRSTLPELCPLDQGPSGKMLPVERKEPLPKAESSDYISGGRSGSSPRPVSLPKAISSEFLSGGRIGPSKSMTLAKAESEDFPSYGRSSPSLALPGCMDPSETSLSWLGKAKENGAFRITVVTWNVGTAIPPSDVTSLLHLNTGDTNDTDMIAIGLQEENSMINKRLKDALFTDQWSELFMDVLSPFNFVLVSTVRMQGVILLVFAKYYHLPFLQDIQTDCTRTGLGGYWGNKGGVSVRLSVFGHMVCFLNCHLPAHLEKAEQRKEDFTTILNMQQFEGRAASGILDHDIVFWFGDLNFRIESLDIRFVKYAIDNSILSQLWEKDQLNIAKGTWPILSGFQEGLLNFPPTFKFDVGTNQYDTSAKKRKPAWTDRILWKIKSCGASHNPSGRRPSRTGLAVTQLCYCSHMEYVVSDHKPVAAIFAVQFASKTDKPLVEIQVADEWSRPEQAIVRYKMATVFHRSSWDWIGLYRVGFRHYKDYVAYVWAKHEDPEGSMYQVVFSEEALPKGKGEYILGYYGNNYSSITGVTEPFQISLPTSEEGSSQTDSSNASSEEEDNSTLVLLAPKSRSPSPGKTKSHRSRSPSLPKFQGLILRPTSRERGPSRSPSPQSRRPVKGEIPSIQLPKEEPPWPNAKSKEPARAAESRESSRAPGYRTAGKHCGTWCLSDDNPLARANPRNLGLLPALRLETVDQAMGPRRASTDQGYPARRMSPTSPTAGAANLFSTSPKERSGSRDSQEPPPAAAATGATQGRAAGITP